MLAQHYGVSSDYLLGLSDTKTSDTDVQSIISFTGLTDDCINTLHAMHEDDLAQDYECSDIGSNKPILDLFSDILHDSYIDHRLIAKYYIALRRNNKCSVYRLSQPANEVNMCEVQYEEQKQ